MGVLVHAGARSQGDEPGVRGGPGREARRGARRRLVLENDVVVGTVNANLRHYAAGAKALARADRGWLEGLITRRVALESWRDALQRGPEDVEVVVDFAA